MDKANVGYRVPIGIQYIFKEDILALTTSTGSGSGRVTVELKDGCFWNDLYFTAGAAKWQEGVESTSAGKLWKQSLQAECLRDTEEEWDALNKLTERPILIRLVFKEDCKLVGSIERPAWVILKTDSSGGMKNLIQVDRSDTERAKWTDLPEEEGSGE